MSNSMTMNDKLEKAFEGLPLDNLSGGDIGWFYGMSALNSTLLPPWWSEKRDRELKRMSVEVDLLSATLFILIMKLYTLPLNIVPRSNLISSHEALAATYDAILQNFWANEGELFLNDLFTSDKGAFLIVEDTLGDYSQPLSSAAIGLRYVPTQQILLQDNYDYPYILLSKRAKISDRPKPPGAFDGRLMLNGRSLITGDKITQRIGSDINEEEYTHTGNLLLHRSRVIRLVQQPMNVRANTYVGLSFISRAFNAAQVLAYAIEHQLEGLGALQSHEIIYATSVSSKALKEAFKSAEVEALNEGKVRNAKRVYVGLRDAAAKIGRVPLKSLPDGFDYEDFVTTTVKLLALAAGVDVDDIAPSSSAGTTKTATLISELKSRFKLVAWFSQKFALELENKFLPISLKLMVGNERDNVNESSAKAAINLSRVEDLLLDGGVTDISQARHNAVINGFITEQQRILMELEDGRLENGLPVRTLFFKTDATYQKLLTIPGLSNPLNLLSVETILGNAEITAAISAVQLQIYEVEKIAINTTSQNIHMHAIKARAALLWLLEELKERDSEIELEPDPGNPDALSNVEDELVEPEIQEQQQEQFDYSDKKKKKRPTSRKGRNMWSNVHTLAKKVNSGQIHECTRGEVYHALGNFATDELAERISDCINRHADSPITALYEELDEILVNISE